MKRFAFLTAFALALTAMPAAAQSIYGGGGVASPQGDDLDSIDSGLILVGGVTFDLSEMFSLYAEGAWGRHDSLGDVTVNPSSLMGGLLLGFGDEDASISPYVFAGGGLQGLALDVTGDPSDRTFGWQAGAGLGFDLFGLPSFLEGRWHSASFDADSEVGELDFSLLSIILGFSFDLSGDN